jgi:hypothetical protein
MTNKIGATLGTLYTIPVEPDAGSYNIDDVIVGNSQRMIDGTLQTCFITSKRAWSVSWSDLTEAEKDTLLTELRRAQHVYWQPPELATAVLVSVRNRSWAETSGATGVYTVQASLEEV